MEVLKHPVLDKQAFTVLSSENNLQHYSSCNFHVSCYFSHWYPNIPISTLSLAMQCH